jgi:hypothetical protein
MTTTLDIHATVLVAINNDSEIVFPVIMEDAPVHLPENGYRRQDHTCPYFAEANEWPNTAVLHGGGRPFSLRR